MNTHIDSEEMYKSGWGVLGVLGVGDGNKLGTTRRQIYICIFIAVLSKGQSGDSNKEGSIASTVMTTLTKNIDDEETCKNCFRIMDAFSLKNGNSHQITQFF